MAIFFWMSPSSGPQILPLGVTLIGVGPVLLSPGLVSPGVLVSPPMLIGPLASAGMLRFTLTGGAVSPGLITSVRVQVTFLGLLVLSQVQPGPGSTDLTV